MSVSITNGIVADSNKRVVIVNGKTIPFHPKMKGNSLTTINEKFYIDGFEYKDGEWKQTIRALYYKYF